MQISGTALVLDEIINHVQSLQRQVEVITIHPKSLLPFSYLLNTCPPWSDAIPNFFQEFCVWKNLVYIFLPNICYFPANGLQFVICERHHLFPNFSQPRVT